MGYGVAEGRAAPSGCRPHAPRVEAVVGFVVRWVFDERGALSSPDGHFISVPGFVLGGVYISCGRGTDFFHVFLRYFFENER